MSDRRRFHSIADAELAEDVGDVQSRLLGLMKSLSAIWRFVAPVAIKINTSCSRAVRPSCASGEDDSGITRPRAPVIDVRV